MLGVAGRETVRYARQRLTCLRWCINLRIAPCMLRCALVDACTLVPIAEQTSVVPPQRLRAIRTRSQMLTFHKRMSIIADTLSGACTHLQHILLVAFLVSSAFSSPRCPPRFAVRLSSKHPVRYGRFSYFTPRVRRSRFFIFPTCIC